MGFVKYILLLSLLASCSTLETLYSVPKEIGRLEGRKEVLKALDTNKKKLNELKKVVAHHLVELSLDDDKDIQVEQYLPQLLLLTQLLNERKQLKKALENATSSESVK